MSSKAGSMRPAMTVRELIRCLRKSNPDGLVFLDSDSNCLLVVAPRPGMHQSFDEDDQFTAEDRRFLLRMRIV